MTDHHETDTDRDARRAEIFAKRTASRLRLVERLRDEDEDALAARLERCGEILRMTCTNCGASKVARTRCDLKWCPACAPLLAFQAVNRFTPAAREMSFPMFVTFTCKNHRDQIGLRNTRRAFTQLRRLRWWKRAVRGGVAQFELTNITEKERKRRKLRITEAQGWHPHVHALIDCRWLGITVRRPPPGCSKDIWKRACRLACEEIAAQWSLCLGRPGSLKIRATFHRDQGDPAAGLKETLKYSVKPGVLDTIEEPIGPLIRELSQTRNLVTWGTLYRHPSLKKRKNGAAPCECGQCGTMVPDAVLEMWMRKR